MLLNCIMCIWSLLRFNCILVLAFAVKTIHRSCFLIIMSSPFMHTIVLRVFNMCFQIYYIVYLNINMCVQNTSFSFCSWLIAFEVVATECMGYLRPWWSFLLVLLKTFDMTKVLYKGTARRMYDNFRGLDYFWQIKNIGVQAGFAESTFSKRFNWLRIVNNSTTWCIFKRQIKLTLGRGKYAILATLHVCKRVHECSDMCMRAWAVWLCIFVRGVRPCVGVRMTYVRVCTLKLR